MGAPNGAQGGASDGGSPLQGDGGASGGDASDKWAAARQRCSTRTNELRAQAGSAAVAPYPEKRACVDQQARDDSLSGDAHGTFGRCGERAQNECPRSSKDPVKAVEACLEMMFDEGPGGGHYENIVGKRYTKMECGFYEDVARSRLLFTQDFWP